MVTNYYYFLISHASTVHAGLSAKFKWLPVKATTCTLIISNNLILLLQPMPRPSSKASTSPDSDDDIYSKIPENPPSPTLPESMSIDVPLINRSESQNKVV